MMPTESDADTFITWLVETGHPHELSSFGDMNLDILLTFVCTYFVKKRKYCDNRPSSSSVPAVYGPATCTNDGSSH